MSEKSSRLLRRMYSEDRKYKRLYRSLPQKVKAAVRWLNDAETRMSPIGIRSYLSQIENNRKIIRVATCGNYIRVYNWGNE